MVALYLSIISGIVVAFQYDPAAPYYSASSLDILVPFGFFWRSLHFYASQVFFLLLLCHAAGVVVTGGFSDLKPRRWRHLVLSSTVALLLLFTGYVLRADATGAAAGAIAENILLSVPVVGETLNSLLFSLNDFGMERIYVNHLVGFLAIWTVLSWQHLRRYSVDWRRYPVLVVAILVFCAVVEAPIEPEHIGVFHINGPWFFMGLQEMLRVIQPFWAGIVWPSLLVVAVILLHPEHRCHRQAGYFIVFWFLLYLGFTLLAISRT